MIVIGFDDETEQATLAFYLKIAKATLAVPCCRLCMAFGPPVQAIGVFPPECWTEAMAISAPADLCKRWNTAKTYFQRDRLPDRSCKSRRLLLGLILGFPKIQPGPDNPQDWCKGPIILPAGWRWIEIDRIWIRGQPWRIWLFRASPAPGLSPSDALNTCLGFRHTVRRLARVSPPSQRLEWHANWVSVTLIHRKLCN